MPNPNINRRVVFPTQVANYVQDYTSSTWSLKSFNFDGTNNIFTGDANASTIVNNAIVGSNKQFSFSFWVKINATGTTKMLFLRDNSTTAVRQFVCFFNNTDKFQVNFYTNSTNNIAWTSTASFTETREWNQFTVVYDGTQSATNRVTVYRNGLSLAGSAVQTGSFTTINNTSVNNIEVGARSNAASYGSTLINSLCFFNTNLSAANVVLLYNNRVPFDVRTNATLNASLVMYIVADTSSSFSSNWTWNDIKGNAVFTSSGMVIGDQSSDAPALKIVSMGMLHGQSNASGRVPMAQLEGIYTGPLPWLKVWNGTGFENIDSTINNNQYSDTQSANEFGIEFKMGDILNRRFKKTIYLFKVVQGGSYLANNAPSWSRNPIGGEFTQLSNDLIALKEWELSNGFTINRIAFIWIQGEADSLVLAYANAYQTSWQNWLTGQANSVFDTKIQQVFFTFPYLYDLRLSANQTLATLLYKSTVNSAKDAVQLTNATYYRTINTDAATVDLDEVHYDKNGTEINAASTASAIITDGF